MNQNVRADVWILLPILSLPYSAFIFLKGREHITLELKDNTRT